eukprot:7890296-Pyramimonas_sp.AAC.1
MLIVYSRPPDFFSSNWSNVSWSYELGETTVRYPIVLALFPHDHGWSQPGALLDRALLELAVIETKITLLKRMGVHASTAQ